MTRRILHIAFLLQAFSAIGLKAQQNPILPGFHADPEVLYSHLTHRYYIYSTTDGTPHWGGYTYRCYSSADLKEWRMRVMCLTHVTDRFTKKMQCAALSNAVHCISRCSTLRWPMQRTAAFDR